MENDTKYLKFRKGNRGFSESSCSDYEPIIQKNNNIYRYISRTSRYEVLKRQKWRCNICGCKLRYSHSSSYGGEVAHIDHIIPYSERDNYPGDINELVNLQALCPSCNLSKGKKKIN